MKRRDRKRCPHSRLEGIYGDAVRFNAWYRLRCLDCGRLLDGPVRLARMRTAEWRPVTEEGPTP